MTLNRLGALEAGRQKLDQLELASDQTLTVILRLTVADTLPTCYISPPPPEMRSNTLSPRVLATPFFFFFLAYRAGRARTLTVDR